MINLPQISDPQLSPNKRQIVFVESEADWKADRRISHMWRVNADGTGLMQMTSGADGENTPRWSPDGNTIAFIAKRGAEPEAVSQVFVIGTAGGEARQITTHATAVSNIQWSPDGATIYFRAADPKSDEQKAREKLKDDVFMFDEDYKQQHLWSVAVTGKTEHRITQGDYSVLAYSLSEDGKKIAFHRAPTPQIEDGDQSEVWVMDSNGSNAVQITRNQVQESDAELSPDGAQVLFLSQANPKFETYYNRKLFVSSSAGGSTRVVMPDLPYEIDKASWSKDGKSIYFLANMGVHSELFMVPAQGGKPEQLTKGNHAIAAWTMSGPANVHVFTSHEMTSPGEVWIMEGGSPRKVTSISEKIVGQYKLPRQERIEWKGADGVTVEGLLYYPIDYQQGKRYPLAVQTHGGPQASDKFGFGGTRITCRCSLPRLCGFAAELSRQHRLRRRIPARHGGALFPERPLGRACRRGLSDQNGHCRSRPHGENGMEWRRPYDQQNHYRDGSVQGGIRRSRSGRLDLHVRPKRRSHLPHAMVRRHALAEGRTHRRLLG